MSSLVCSAKACRTTATWAHLWNNPTLHTPDRRKVWLACDDHKTSLGEFLSIRGFLVTTVAADAIPATAG
jgi:hypothetical protein